MTRSALTVAFRADASLEIGSGHVMRCLTLADALKEQGAECHFICREHPGHLIEPIKDRGYNVHVLGCGHGAPAMPDRNLPKGAPEAGHHIEVPHAGWLGATQDEDAAGCAVILSGVKPDWLIVDHYALDQRWEVALRPYYRKLMVIDDLADRVHCADILLDQNLGRNPQDYADLVPPRCEMLVGPKYALLRPEFAELRDYSLRRRANPQLKHLLITMGGVDKDNVTGLVLESLKTCELPPDCHITVVMGASAPWLDQVRAQAKHMQWPTEVLVNIRDMAQRMADSDLAIGAAGSTSWERCCLGLPTLMVMLAENQSSIAKNLHLSGAAVVLQSLHEIKSNLCKIEYILENFPRISGYASRVTDGRGVARLINKLYIQ